MLLDPHHRAKQHQLWIDRVRDELRKTPLMAELDRSTRSEMLLRMTRWDPRRVLALSPAELKIAFAEYDLVDPPPVVALRALVSKGYPHRKLAFADYAPCDPKVQGALHWCNFQILGGPETLVMLLDDRTAKAVAASKNEPFTAAELQQLPHNPCLIEFYRPIEIAETIKRGVRLRAHVGFTSIGTIEAPAAVVSFFLDYWESIPSSQQKSNT